MPGPPFIPLLPLSYFGPGGFACGSLHSVVTVASSGPYSLVQYVTPLWDNPIVIFDTQSRSRCMFWLGST